MRKQSAELIIPSRELAAAVFEALQSLKKEILKTAKKLHEDDGRSEFNELVSRMYNLIEAREVLSDLEDNVIARVENED